MPIITTHRQITGQDLIDLFVRINFVPTTQLYDEEYEVIDYLTHTLNLLKDTVSIQYHLLPGQRLVSNLSLRQLITQFAPHDIVLTVTGQMLIPSTTEDDRSEDGIMGVPSVSIY